MGRQIKSCLDALRPSKVKHKANYDIPSSQFYVGGRVPARYHTSNKQLWKFGPFVKKLGRLHYLVKLDNGYTLKRHTNQLLSTEAIFQPTLDQQITSEQNGQKEDRTNSPRQSQVREQGVGTLNPESTTLQHALGCTSRNEDQGSSPVETQARTLRYEPEIRNDNQGYTTKTRSAKRKRQAPRMRSPIL